MSKTSGTVYTRRPLTRSKKDKSIEKPDKDSWMSENDSDCSEIDEDIMVEKKNLDVNKGDGTKTSTLGRFNPECAGQSSSIHNSFLCFFIFVLLPLIICLSIWFLKSRSESNSEKSFKAPNLSSSPHEKSAGVRLILEEIKKVKRNFPLQSKHVWTNTLAALTSIATDEPDQPAVLLLISSNTDKAKKTLKCLSLQLGAITNKVFNTSTEMMIQADGFIQLHRKEEMREELDRKLKSILNKSFAAVVPQLQEIPPYVAMMLHAYCDNFMALFKKRVIILTAAFGSQLLETETQVDQHLHHLWDAELGIDTAASLVSRLANMPVFVQPEEDNMPCL